MEKFCSFLVVTPDHVDLFRAVAKDAGWNIDFIQDPTSRFWYAGNSEIECNHPNYDHYKNSKYQPGQLLIILEESDEKAENIINLIYASLLILHGFPYKLGGSTTPFPIPGNENELNDLSKNVFQQGNFMQQFATDRHLIIAFHLARNALRQESYKYAIHKLANSYETESVTPKSLDPRHGQKFQKSSESHLSHVISSIAINLAFSAIEEMGLKIISSKEKPRWLNGKNGTWNPVVLRSIQNRLANIGISSNEEIDWVIRGINNDAEIALLDQLGLNKKLLNGDCSDLKIKLPEALHLCSFIRNYQTAHAFGHKSKLIGPYEVFNVQNTARRLILKANNTWNTEIDHLMEMYSCSH